MKSKKNKVIRGMFQYGESAFPSSKDKREKIMREVEEIMRSVDKLNSKRRSNKS